MTEKQDGSINLYTVKDIKDIFRCGQRQAYELVNANGFPSIRIGGKILVERKALENWLDKNKGKAVTIK